MKVWVFHSDQGLIGVYSTKPNQAFIKSALSSDCSWLSDESIEGLLSRGWATDGYDEWTLTEVELHEPNP